MKWIMYLNILFNSILTAAIKRFYEANVYAVTFPTLDSNGFLNQCLAKNGFLPIQKIAALGSKLLRLDIIKNESVLLVKVINNSINRINIINPAHWYFTDLFNEGID